MGLCADLLIYRFFILRSSNFGISVSAPAPAPTTGRLWDGFLKSKRDTLVASNAPWAQLSRARSLRAMGVAWVEPVCRWHRSGASRGNLQCTGMSPEVSLLNSLHAHRLQGPSLFVFFSFFFRILSSTSPTAAGAALYDVVDRDLTADDRTICTWYLPACVLPCVIPSSLLGMCSCSTNRAVVHLAGSRSEQFRPSGRNSTTATYIYMFGGSCSSLFLGCRSTHAYPPPHAGTYRVTTHTHTLDLHDYLSILLVVLKIVYQVVRTPFLSLFRRALVFYVDDLCVFFFFRQSRIFCTRYLSCIS